MWFSRIVKKEWVVFILLKLVIGVDNVFSQQEVRICFFDGLSFSPYPEIRIKIDQNTESKILIPDSSGAVLLDRSGIEITYNDYNGKIRLWCRTIVPGSDSVVIKSNSGKNKISGGFPLDGKLEIYVLRESEEFVLLNEITIRNRFPEKNPALAVQKGIEDKKSVEVKKETDKGQAGIHTAGTVYRVQILTSGKLLAATDPVFKGEKDVWTYHDNGIYKYTVGNFNNVGEAAQIQELMRQKGFKGAFVVKFVDGVRVK
ncbi:MAG: hypothetical protein ACK40M_00850 [Flavobacteriales bacterium]